MPVAVKTLVFSTGAGGKRKRALLEAALSHSISHPNIVATFAVDAHPISDGADFGARNTGSRAKPSGPVVSCRRPVMMKPGRRARCTSMTRGADAARCMSHDMPDPAGCVRTCARASFVAAAASVHGHGPCHVCVCVCVCVVGRACMQPRLQSAHTHERHLCSSAHRQAPSNAAGARMVP